MYIIYLIIYIFKRKKSDHKAALVQLEWAHDSLGSFVQ